MTNSLESVIVEPTKQASASVIWLHGLGADGHDFEPIVPQLRLPETLAVRFIFPHAPVRPITLNGGAPMRAWCDILELTDDAKIDEAGAYESQTAIEALIHREIKSGIIANQIIIAGFSLGGAMAIQTGLRFTQPLAGVIALSTFLAKDNRIEIEPSAANQKTPIFMAHGDYDMIVPRHLGLKTCERLRALNYSVSWHTYPIDHTVSMQEINDISIWIQQALAGDLPS